MRCTCSNSVALDHVADAHVLIGLERHAAFLAGEDFARVILEALELRELAFVDHHIVTDESDVGATLHLAVGDPATGHLADLGDAEDLQNLCIAQHGLAQHRREHAGHGLFHIIDQVVDDVVVADLDARLLGRPARFLVGAHVEPDDRRMRC